MRKSRRYLLVLGLLFLSLFVLGPQMGSIDADGDGYPETAIVVASSSPTVKAPSSARKNLPLQEIYNSLGLAVITIQQYHFKINEPDFASQVGRSALQSFCLLRC